MKRTEKKSIIITITLFLHVVWFHSICSLYWDSFMSYICVDTKKHPSLGWVFFSYSSGKTYQFANIMLVRYTSAEKKWAAIESISRHKQLIAWNVSMILKKSELFWRVSSNVWCHTISFFFRLRLTLIDTDLFRFSCAKRLMASTYMGIQHICMRNLLTMRTTTNRVRFLNNTSGIEMSMRIFQCIYTHHAHHFINNAYFLSHLWSHQHYFRYIMMSWCVPNRANNFYTIFYCHKMLNEYLIFYNISIIHNKYV